MKKIYLLAIPLLLGCTAYGQGCRSKPLDSISFVNQPWVGNNGMLTQLYDSIAAIVDTAQYQYKTQTTVGGFDAQTFFWVPIKAYVITNGSTASVTIEDIEDAIRGLNENFRGANSINGVVPPHSKIQFYLKCNVSFVNYPALFNFNYENSASETLWKSFQQSNFEYGALNVYFPNVISTDDPGILASYVDELPQSNSADKFNAYRVWMNRSQVGTSTLAHEVGHALGLSHTHVGYPAWKWSNNGLAKSCQQEKVDRNAQNGFWDCGNTKTNCQWYGDGLCDTKADPELEASDVDLDPTGSWEYEGGGSDEDGDPWDPPIFNFMSYSNPSIRMLFSQGQTGIMYSNLLFSPVSGFDIPF